MAAAAVSRAASVSPASSDGRSSAASIDASMKAMRVAPPKSADIAGFNTDKATVAGWISKTQSNLKMSIRKQEKVKGSQHDFKKFCTAAKPAILGQFIAVGTDDPEATQHFLSIIDAKAMDDARADPVVCYIRTAEHFADVKWLNSKTLVAATGKGNMKLFEFNPEAKTITHVGDLADAAGSYIRELAVKPGSANELVIGGFDQKLSFLDLNSAGSPYTQILDLQSVIGSVKWAPFQNGIFPACTLDVGKFFMFDVRTAITESAASFDLKQEDLYTHERYNDYNVLFGFGDGCFKHIDMRQTGKVLASIQDPYVEAIGGIEWNADASAFVVSGYTDHSVWKVDNGVAKIWAHSQNGDDLLRAKGWHCAAAWYDATTVASCDSEGAVELFLQDFA